MKKIITALVLLFLLQPVFAQVKPVYHYTGVEEMQGYRDPARPKWVWYHLSQFRFVNDSVFLEQCPIAIHKKDTMFSASDGGFYSYRGKLRIENGKYTCMMNMYSCDYCYVPSGDKREKKYLMFEAGTRTGEILVNKQPYRRK